MGVYSRFSKVLEADGTPMSVRLQLAGYRLAGCAVQGRRIAGADTEG